MVEKLKQNKFENTLLDYILVFGKNEPKLIKIDSFMLNDRNISEIKLISVIKVSDKIIDKHDTILLTDFDIKHFKSNEIKLNDSYVGDTIVDNIVLINGYEYIYGFKLGDYESVQSLDLLLNLMTEGKSIVLTKLRETLIK